MCDRCRRINSSIEDLEEELNRLENDGVYGSYVERKEEALRELYEELKDNCEGD